MLKPDKGEVVAVGNCDCCGGKVQVKIDKRGLAYFICPGFYDDGEKCGHRAWMSGRESRRLIEAWAKRKAAENVEIENPGPGRGEPGGAADRDRRADIPDRETGGENGLFG